jgi:beta-barrel assembly-enhancing protease
MSRRFGSVLVLLLTLCGTAMTACAMPADTVEATEATATGDPAYLALLAAAAKQAVDGDVLGASIAYDRLLADPRLATVDAPAQSGAWEMGAWVAAEQRQPDVADQRLAEAIALDPRNASARVTLAGNQVFDQQFEAAADSLIQALQVAGGEEPVVKELVWHLDTALKTMPEKRRAVLQGLFDRGWKNHGVEPTEIWMTLATLQVEADDRDAVAATLERIDSPLDLVALRGDKRFDRYLRRDDPRFDPVSAARRHIDRLRVQATLAWGYGENAVQLTNALLVAGEAEEVIGMTETVAAAGADAKGPPPQGARYLASLLDSRSAAQLQLGRPEEAVVTQVAAARVADPDVDGVSQALNLAHMYASLHRPALARQTIASLTQLSRYGEGERDAIALRTALQLNDATAAQSAREALQTQRVDNPSLYLYTLVIDDRMDEAASLLIQQLHDPMERNSTLLHLQELREYPPLPADTAIVARWNALKQRDDVQAAIRRVGRIERYPLYRE